MIKLSKKVAFAIFVVVTILLAVSVANVNWDVLKSDKGIFNVFKELREPLVFLLLAIFFIDYYVKRLKEDK